MDKLDSLFKSVVIKSMEEKIIKRAYRDVLTSMYLIALLIIYVIYIGYFFFKLLPVTDFIITSLSFLVFIFLPLIIGEYLDPLKKLNINQGSIHLVKILIDLISKLDVNKDVFILKKYKIRKTQFIYAYLRNQFYQIDKNLNESFIFQIDEEYFKLMNRMMRLNGKQFGLLIESNHRQSLINYFEVMALLYFNKLGYKVDNVSYEDQRIKLFNSFNDIENLELLDTEREKFDILGYLKSYKARVHFTFFITLTLIVINYTNADFFTPQTLTTINIISLALAVFALRPSKTGD